MFSEALATRVGRVTLQPPRDSSSAPALTSFSPPIHSIILSNTTFDMETVDIARLKSGEVNLGVCLSSVDPPWGVYTD